MELLLGALAAVIVELLVLALLSAPRRTLRVLARPFSRIRHYLRGLRIRPRAPEGRVVDRPAHG